MALCETPDPSGNGRRTREYSVATQMPGDVCRQRFRRRIPPRRLLLEGLQRNPVKVALQLSRQRRRIGSAALGDILGLLSKVCKAGARWDRLFLSDDSLDFGIAGPPEYGWVERQRT